MLFDTAQTCSGASLNQELTRETLKSGFCSLSYGTACGAILICFDTAAQTCSGASLNPELTRETLKSGFCSLSYGTACGAIRYIIILLVLLQV